MQMGLVGLSTQILGMAQLLVMLFFQNEEQLLEKFQIRQNNPLILIYTLSFLNAEVLKPCRKVFVCKMELGSRLG